MVSKWLFEGELDDPYGEFFVTKDPSVSDEVRPPTHPRSAADPCGSQSQTWIGYIPGGGANRRQGESTYPSAVSQPSLNSPSGPKQDEFVVPLCHTGAPRARPYGGV
eukprot:1183783-Prorocentrum_minimum.AAC.4